MGIDVDVKHIQNDFTAEKKDRIHALYEKFKSIFNVEPEFVARAPGRVNLIGEHIDYCGYSVLPMAIEHDILAAVSVNHDSSLIHLSNYDPSFHEIKIDTKDINISKDKPEWHDYFLSGYKGIMDKFNPEVPKGMNVCVYGTVPKCSGLSSSSALVICSALATIYANNLSLSKTELAELCAVSERYVGTQGGGMDQAISILAEEGSAKLIDFNPLKVTNIKLPDGAQFVVTNCCVEMNKAASNHFNTRVVECRLASKILAKSQNLDWKNIKKPLDVQRALNVSLLELIELTKKVLHAEEYTLEKVIQILETTHDELVSNSFTQNTINLTSFQLHKRILHVFSEAQRVYDFKEACSLAEPSEAFKKLGDLMNQSHESCRDLYDCSCPELDELTEICRQSGAFGSRLTGAGWGGCCVSLISADKVEEFLHNVQNSYYSKTDRLKSLFKSAAFTTKPSQGIFIILP